MKELYSKRRQMLAEMLCRGDLAIFHSGELITKSADSIYPFCVDKSFYYLTGLDEANLCLVLKSEKDGSYKETLYINRFDSEKAKWVTRPYDINEAKEISGISECYYIDEFYRDLKDILALGDIYIEKNPYRQRDTFFAESLAKEAEALSDNGTVVIRDCHDLTAELRRIKDDKEIEYIKKAIQVTRLGILDILKKTKPNMYEYDVEAFFKARLMHEGRHTEAFPTIVGSGLNATVLHYDRNTDILNDGDLVLIDLGAEHMKYHADISRTFPVNGKFSPRQKVLYNIVLAGQEHVVKAIKPGVSREQLKIILEEFYARELAKIGLIKKPEEVKEYFYHGVSHSLGLDTHDFDVRARSLDVGTVITVEPGLYIAKEKIGIRIEDNFLVTKDGCINLSADIPKTVEEIEELMMNK